MNANRLQVGDKIKLQHPLSLICGLSKINLKAGDEIEILETLPFGAFSVVPTSWKDWAKALVVGNHKLVVYREELDSN